MSESPCTSPTSSQSSSPTSSASSSSSSSSSTTSSSSPQQQQKQLVQQEQQPTIILAQHNSSSSNQCTCPTSLHTLNETIRYSQCPVCLSKFDLNKLPIALSCSHTICIQCATLLVPGIHHHHYASNNTSSSPTPPPLPSPNNINESLGVVNYPLLAFLDYRIDGVHHHLVHNHHSLPPVTSILCKIARLIKSHTVSRSIHRKTILLINSLTPNEPPPHNPLTTNNSKLIKPVKSLGERCLVELTSSCSHLSHYHAQQQLWAAIRARACQFMGPAMQDEALKLVLLALEDGSALSRKVLVMFVVQRLAPQFPQASKTSVGHIVQLLYRASAFDVLKRQANSSLMTLRPEFRNYEALRREHDTQIMKIGLEAGIRFTPEQWSSLLYGDTSQKPLMQSIIDKLQSPQTFQELLKEYLVSVQRLSNPDSTFLVSLHPHFKVLATIDGAAAAGSEGPTEPPGLVPLLESLHSVLVGLITFTANRKHQRSNGSRPPGQQPQTQSVVYKPSYPKPSSMVVAPDCPQNPSPPSPPPPPPPPHHAPNNNIVNMMQANLCI